ncbi:hypothetical protein TEA_017982 [Camellia sinensis var. sinensis]|uniref:UDP-3-O-[3-hydroxymyristoyl] glucosamine N-acyltransferase non-repeat region domain-containing protein n=1 Tax=Camellia sinensis var. sinensis TaxID=542762 RepID=A0A4V3WR58_CAMSN|nr:hypothetical protein TEA_017982 [Camellia sinensis var. sinensis]
MVEQSMALRRLACVGSSTTIFHSITRHNFSVSSADQFAFKFGSFKTEDDQGFQKWHNGGGTFHKSACVAATALIEIGAIVHPEAVIGANAHIGSGAIIGPAVTIGQSTKLGYNVALSNCAIGDYCVIHNGVCIGQDGFGFFLDEHGDMVKKPQVVHFTLQIGHNVVIGKYCMLCGQAGIAGSVTMGDYVTLGGRVAVRDHVSIGSKVRLAGNSCVTKDINEPGDYGGFPAVPIREWQRQVAIHHRTLK